uniref:Uncharacterized protein n=1 Tax=Angiostrongylus cantonensis TaxID=6313 RepID=A0A158P7E0_ANGCA
MPSEDRFADAVKPTLEALLSDLQHTTEVLRRANTTSPPQDIEPIYQEQAIRGNIKSQCHLDGLHNLEELVNSYSLERQDVERQSVDIGTLPKDGVHLGVVSIRFFVVIRSAPQCTWGFDHASQCSPNLPPFGVGNLVLDLFGRKAALTRYTGRRRRVTI